MICIKIKHLLDDLSFIRSDVSMKILKFWTLKSSTSTFFVKMYKIWHRGVIKYLHKKELAPTTLHADMAGNLGDTAPSYEIVIRWAAHCKHFKMDKESLEDVEDQKHCSCEQSCDG